MGLEVAFKSGCLFTGAKGDCGFDCPGFVFCCVGDLAGVVSLEAGFQVLCESGVMAGVVGLADEDVDVVECIVHKTVKIKMNLGLGYEVRRRVSLLCGVVELRNSSVSFSLRSQLRFERTMACQGVVRNA